MKNMMCLRKSEQIHRAALVKGLVENRRNGLAKEKITISVSHFGRK